MLDCDPSYWQRNRRERQIIETRENIAVARNLGISLNFKDLLELGLTERQTALIIHLAKNEDLYNI